MEIIYKTTEEKSNFSFCSDIFKNKKVLNGFNKLDESIMCESIADDDFNCQNVSFDKDIIAYLYLCYPFNVVIKNEIKFRDLYQLISEIRKTYRQIYHEEKKTMTKSIRKNKNLINRGISNGIYGIWGHDIYDLVIEAIKVYETEDKPIIDVSIGS